MDANAFADAPPPIRRGEYLLVPLHIRGLRASVTIEAAALRATADATMTYVVGPSAGHPFFDLRQIIEQCWIDGRRVDPAMLAQQSVGEAGDYSAVRVVREWQHAGSMHTLRVVYRMGLPMSDLGGAYPPELSWLEGPRVRWSCGMADLYAGRYLEAWFPSNLPFDHFPFALELSIIGTSIVHTVITNGQVTTTGPNRWSIGFPGWFTTMSPLIELHSADAVQVASTAVALPVARRPIAITACKLAGGDEDLTASLRQIAALLSEQERTFGEFSGDSYTCFFHGAAGGMEYGHATTTSASALRHEVIHSWFARGVTPASQADGWWDEGFTRYIEVADEPEPFDYDSPPVVLCSRDPYQRTTSPRSYEAGSRVFRGIAALIGPQRLLVAMNDLYKRYRGMSVSTATLETHLIDATGAMSLVDGFHRFVYGLDDPVAEPRLLVEGVGIRDGRLVVRVRNAGPGLCRHFVVVITPDGSHQFNPPIAAVAQFDLAPGRRRAVTVRLSRLRFASLQRQLRASVHIRGAGASTQRSAVVA